MMQALRVMLSAPFVYGRDLQNSGRNTIAQKTYSIHIESLK